MVELSHYQSFKSQETYMFDLGQSNHLLKINHSKTQTPSFLLYNPLAEEQNRITQDSADEAKNDGKWTLREMMRYYLFLIEYKHLFKSKHIRKSKKVFSLMAKHILTRKTTQCKSHHQKIQRSFRNIEEIIKEYRLILSPLKEEWKQFIRTEKDALINQYPQRQECYRVLQFKRHIKIQILEECIPCYQP